MNSANLDNKVKKDFLTYANAVIKSRAISDARDNLKPVHRRILYTMFENKLLANKKTVKSNNVVGKVMIRHPHGDSSIYDAMIRLAQPWKMRYPLVEVQGNSGNISGDGPAAMRYTEVRLSKFGEMMMTDINKKSVKFKESYDGSTTEPVVLPSAFPNILCNGNVGIAVGTSTSIVPHNLKEVCDGILAYLKSPSITTEQLMKFIPAPDFPTGGTITNAGNMKDIYATGRGTITLRSKYRIENVGQKQHIVIEEVPYLITIEDGVIKQLKKLVLEEGFDLIEDFKNNTGKKGIELRIILKKGANVYKVLETIWKKTRLEITQRVANTVIVEGNPVTLNLKGMIQHYINHRSEILINIASYERNKANRRTETVKGLIKAMTKIDEVIKLIRASSNTASANQKLVALLEITPAQASSVLEMRLSRLSKLDSMDLTHELEELQKKLKEYDNIINNEGVRMEMIKKEVGSLKRLYGDERRTTLIYGGDEAEGYPVEKLKVLFMANGSTFATQKKLADLDIKRKAAELNNSAVILMANTETDKTLTVFKDDGTMERVKLLTMATEKIEVGMFNSRPLAAYDFDDVDNLKDYIVFVTSGGMVKKTATSEYIKAKNNARTIKVKGDQELIFVGMANDEDSIAVLDKKLSFFKVKNITATSKLTIGSKANNSKKAIAAAVVASNETLLMLSADGKGKVTKASDLSQTAKGGNGQVVAKDTILIHTGSKEYIINDGSKNLVITKNISAKGKTAVGSKIITGTPISVAG